MHTYEIVSDLCLSMNYTSLLFDKIHFMEMLFEVLPLPLSAYSPRRPHRRALISYPILASPAANIPSVLTPPPPAEFDGWQPDPSKSTGLSGLALFGVIVGALLVVVLLLVCAWFCSCLQQICRELEDEPEPVPVRPVENQNGCSTVGSHQQQQQSNETPLISEVAVVSQQNQQLNEIPPTSNISIGSQQHEQQNESSSTNVYYSTVSQQHGQHSEIPSASSLQHQQQNERPSSDETPVGSQQQQQQQQQQNEISLTNEASVGSQQQQQEQQNEISLTISPEDPSVSSQQQNETASESPKIFTYQELQKATNGFSQNNHIGTGGFGLVYKGVLQDGMEVAIKKLNAESRQGENEFQAEVNIISDTYHGNLVHLVGYCISGTERLLVYEFIQNESLYSHLHGTDKPVLDLKQRFNIALGIAKGLVYLHESSGKPKIVHRDIKSANILLDKNFEAKVADFGLAKLFSEDRTHVTTAVKGTLGYLDPEYFSMSQLTEKSDVYSFGVLLLELITGSAPWKKPLAREADSFFTQAREDSFHFADPKLPKYDKREMYLMVACAACCVRDSGKDRPQMIQILKALEGNLNVNELTERIKPRSDVNADSLSMHRKKFLKMLQGNGENTSSESSN